MYFYKELCIKYFWKKKAFYSGKHHYPNFIGPYALTIPIFLLLLSPFFFYLSKVSLFLKAIGLVYDYVLVMIQIWNIYLLVPRKGFYM